MTMRRGGWLNRERATLTRALGAMVNDPGHFCADCGTIAGRLVLDPAERKFRFIVVHLHGCPVLRSERSRLACDDFMREHLARHKHFVADYWDDLIGQHREYSV